jgi:hypothetical protein
LAETSPAHAEAEKSIKIAMERVEKRLAVAVYE